MNQEVIIRRAVLSDAERLAVLSGVLGYPVDASTMVSRLEPLLTRSQEIVLVAVPASGAVVGWLHGSELQLLECGRHCELRGLVVDAAYRGQGVGRRLVEALEQWALGRGLDQIAVRSNVVRAESHPFYERIGFVRVKTQHAYRKSLK